MKEIQNVKPIRVVQKCENCTDGYLMSTGLIYQSNPLKYQHSCNNCFSEVTFNREYPCIDYQIIETPKKEVSIFTDDALFFAKLKIALNKVILLERNCEEDFPNIYWAEICSSFEINLSDGTDQFLQFIKDVIELNDFKIVKQ